MAGSIIQTTFAAVAFAGAGFLFQHLNKTGYEDEMKRHNKALENLAAAKEQFYENEIRKKDEIARKRVELADANADINATNKALDYLYRIQHAGKTFNYTNPPKLSAYYTPSREMDEYQTLVSGGIGIGLGYLLFSVI